MSRPCFGIQNIYKLTGGHRGVPSPNIDIPSNTVNPVRCGANINLSVTYLRQICINKKNGILDFCFAFTEKKVVTDVIVMTHPKPVMRGVIMLIETEEF